MIERRRVGDTRSKVLKVPQQTESLQDGGGAVRLRLAGGLVNTVVLNESRESIRRDQESGYTSTVTVKVQGVALAVASLGIGLVVRAHSQWGSNVVEETTGLVEGQKKERFFPLRTVTESFVDLLDKDLTVRDVSARVHGIGVETAAGRVEVRKLRKLTQISILEEVLDGNNVLFGVGRSPVEEETVRGESTVGAVVVEPANSLAAGLLEDVVDLDGGNYKGVVVGSVAIRGTGNSTESVRVGGLKLSANNSSWTIPRKKKRKRKLTPGTQENQELNVTNSSIKFINTGICSSV